MHSSMVPLEEALPVIGYGPLQFLKEFLDGGDVPPVYRHAGELCLDRVDVAAWKGKARIRALEDRIEAPHRVIDTAGVAA
jgi:hypothetical protein